MSSTEIATITAAPHGALAISPDQARWSDVQRATFAQMGIEDASEADALVFLNQAQRTGLDPFTRQIYMIGRKSKVNGQFVTKWTIQAAIDGLRVIAQRSGKYAGQVGPFWCGGDGVWVDVWLQSYPPSAAKVGVLRRGFTEPMWGVARFESYAAYKDEWAGGSKTGGRTLSGQWPTMPDVMIAKCAESLALRKAFPQDLSGIYTSEEMDQADALAPVVQGPGTGQVVQAQALPAGPAIPAGFAARNEATSRMVAALGKELAVELWNGAGLADAQTVNMAVVDGLIAKGVALLDDRAKAPAADPLADYVAGEVVPDLPGPFSSTTPNPLAAETPTEAIAADGNPFTLDD